jgi:hypothetical protein
VPTVLSARPRPLHFAAFVINPTGHVIQCAWRRALARQADHASKGRIAWNIVADDVPNAWSEEYVEVTYKLWEGSWEDDALRRDGRPDSHAGAGKVHRINH